MSNSLKDSIRSHMEQKTTDEIRDIWVKNNRNEYSDETFEVISEILRNRNENGENIPQQIKQPEIAEHQGNIIVVLLRVIAIVTIIAGLFISVISYDASLGLCIGALVWSFIAAIFQLGFAEIICILNKIYWNFE